MGPLMSREDAEFQRISSAILILRGHRIILDRDLAALYGVSTLRLNEAVKRNSKRFPDDFMFRLTREEAERSRSQIAILKMGRGHNIKYLPYAFTEHGAIQASNVLNSPRAVEMGVLVVRAFVQLRLVLASNKELTEQLNELERKYLHHDKAIAAILSTIRQLLHPPDNHRRGIGFTAEVE